MGMGSAFLNTAPDHPFREMGCQSRQEQVLHCLANAERQQGTKKRWITQGIKEDRGRLWHRRHGRNGQRQQTIALQPVCHLLPARIPNDFRITFENKLPPHDMKNLSQYGTAQTTCKTRQERNQQPPARRQQYRRNQDSNKRKGKRRCRNKSNYRDDERIARVIGVVV